MKLRWDYPLFFCSDRSSNRCEGPIHIQGRWLYCVFCNPTPILHILDRDTGTGRHIPLCHEVMLSGDCFFLPSGDDVILYSRDLYKLRDGQLHRDLPFPDRGKLASHLLLGDRLYLVFKGRNAALVCVDIRNMHILWETAIHNDSYYTVGPVTLFGDRLACFGRDRLLYLDPDSGRILDELKLSRIGKLYQPTDLGDGKLLLGYTNWSNAGVLCLDTATQKVLWRHKRNFEGPLLRCSYLLHGDWIFWVKNDTELCCVSLSDGTELYRRWTDPWLYSPPEAAPEGLIFGTSGGDGFLRCLDPVTGDARWKHPMKGGCIYYARHGGDLLTGDYTGRIFRIHSRDGNILETFGTGTEVVGRYHIHENSLYTVLWQDEDLPCRLVRIELNET